MINKATKKLRICEKNYFMQLPFSYILTLNLDEEFSQNPFSKTVYCYA
jgi:hypothetical protein